MRTFHFFVLLSIAIACPQARAEELASSPGWSLNKITESKEAEENTYQEARTYFSLKPPDGRPAISVDSRTAERLRSGEAYAESIYQGQAKSPQETKKEEEEYVYGRRGSNLVIPEPVNSTLTVEEGYKNVAISAATNQPKPPQPPVFSQFTNGGLNSTSSHATAARAIAMAQNAPPPTGRGINGAGASLNPNAPPETGGGPPPIVDPRAIANAQNNAPPPDTTPKAGSPPPNMGISIPTPPRGFGFDVGKDGKSTEAKNFITWPNGDPAEKKDSGDGSGPKCAASEVKTYDKAGIQRITMPSGCSSVRIRAWGAGGGAGNLLPTGDIIGGDGGGGAYVYNEGVIDTVKYDLIIVVGGPGGDGKGSTSGLGGFPGGGAGGGQATMGAGGGGGYSGVFLVERGKDYGNGNDKPLFMNLAVVVAAGGGGGSSSGEIGGAGGIENGGGPLGASSNRGGSGSGNGKAGWELNGGAGGNSDYVHNSGGGGGGGYYGGGGGNGARADEEVATAGGGGSSYFRFLDKTETRKGDGSKAGNSGYTPRGKAGDSGHAGLVILEFF